MFLIYLMLKEKLGYDVDIDLTENFDYKNDEDFLIKMKENISERNNAVKEKSKVILKELWEKRKYE